MSRASEHLVFDITVVAMRQVSAILEAALTGRQFKVEFVDERVKSEVQNFANELRSRGQRYPPAPVKFSCPGGESCWMEADGNCVMCDLPVEVSHDRK